MQTKISQCYEPLKPEIANYLGSNPFVLDNSFKSLSAGDIRESFHQTIDNYKTNVSAASIKSEDILIQTSQGTIRLRLYSPILKANNIATIVYYHGGGWIAGSIESYDNICRYIAKQCNCFVISVDYTLAPEAKFPEIIKQCYSALQWVHSNIERLGGHKNYIAVAGDSAGGNLAIAVSLMHRDLDQSWNIMYQVLICPITDVSSFDKPSYSLSGKYGLSQEVIEHCRDFYLRNIDEAYHPYASPLLAANFYDLPPAIVVSAEFDILRSETYSYLKCLMKHNVSAEYYCMSGMIHSSVFWPGCSHIMREEISQICKIITHKFQSITN